MYWNLHKLLQAFLFAVGLSLVENVITDQKCGGLQLVSHSAFAAGWPQTVD